MAAQSAHARRELVPAAIVLGGRYGYNCGGPEVRGGIMDVLLALIFGFIFGVVVGYGIRENISRRRRVAARAAADEERYRELSADHTLPRGLDRAG